MLDFIFVHPLSPSAGVLKSHLFSLKRPEVPEHCLRISMVSVLIGAVCNITLDPIFIFVLHMGVKGAALATIISQAISTIWVVLFLCGKKTQLHLRKKYMRLVPKVILPCVALGLAAFIMQASESVVSVCFNSSLLRYGGDIAVGSMTILTSVMQFAMLPLQGIAQGAQPISSYNYGAKNADSASVLYYAVQLKQKERKQGIMKEKSS